jgi:hypothetical protein
LQECSLAPGAYGSAGSARTEATGAGEPMSTFEQHDVATDHRDAGNARRLFRAALGSFVVSWIAGTAGLLLVLADAGELIEPFLNVGISTLALAPFLALVGLVALLRPKRSRAKVSVARGVLQLAPIGGAGGRLVSRAMIASAVHAADGIVAITMRDGDVLRVDLGDAARADAMLDALAIGASSRRAEIRWQSPVVREVTRAAAFVGVGVAGTLTALAMPSLELTGLLLWNVPFAAVVVSALIARRVGQREIEVGADAITSRSPARAVKLADVAAVRAEAREIAFALRDGSSVRIPADAPADVRRGLERRIEEVRARAADRRDDATLAALLDPAGRAWDEWRASLARIRSAGATHRDPAVMPARLEALLADPAALPVQRVGAAIALAEIDRAQAVPRIRVAAETSASPSLRAALEAALDGSVDDATLDAAVRESTLSAS